MNPGREFIHRVVSLAGIYLAAGWGVIQAADVIAPHLGLPAWTAKLTIVLVTLGFPVAMVLLWTSDHGRSRPMALAPGDAHAGSLAAERRLGKSPPIHNLPVALDAFVGRERETVELGKEFPAHARFVSIIGIGGIGKTRFALEFSRSRLKSWRDGVRFFRLESLSQEELLPGTLCREVGVKAASREEELDALVEYFRERQCLLIFDNCEHLITACGTLVRTLLEQCPGVVVLATSREPLGVAGESVVVLSGLEAPAENSNPARLLDYPATRLFVDRARKSAEFKDLDLDDHESIAMICREVNGIPLAIEIAASWVGPLTPREVSRELNVLLSRDLGRTVPARQRSLFACLEWSYTRLTAQEKSIFAGLSIFDGGAPLTAIGPVLGISEAENVAMLAAIKRLTDHCLLQHRPLRSESRYEMLETVRRYALEILSRDQDGYEAIRRRHAGWYADLAERSEANLHGPPASSTIAVLDAEINNLRSAIVFCQESNEVAILSRFAALYWYWFVRGHWTEASNYLDRVIVHENDLPSTQAARVYLASGTMHWAAGTLEHADACLEKAETLYRGVNSDWGLAQATHIRGHVLHQQGKLHDAMVTFEAATAYWRRKDDPYWLALLLIDVGAVATDLGDGIGATAVLEEALAIASRNEDRHGQGNALMHIGVLHRRNGDFARAEAALAKASQVLRELGYLRGLATVLKHQADVCLARKRLHDVPKLLEESLRLQVQINHGVGIARSLESVSKLELLRGRATNAAMFLGSAHRLRGEGRSTLAGVSETEVTAIVEKTKAALGEQAYRHSWEEGVRTDTKTVLARAYAALRERGGIRLVIPDFLRR